MLRRLLLRALTPEVYLGTAIASAAAGVTLAAAASQAEESMRVAGIVFGVVAGGLFVGAAILSRR